MTKLILAPAIVATLLNLGVQTDVHAQSEREQVLAVVQGFFDSMVDADTSKAQNVLLVDGKFHSIREVTSESGRELVVRSSPHSEYIESLKAGETGYLERMWDPEVTIRGRVAVVTTPYDFYVDGRFSHCGTDVFSLLQTADGWKITSGTYTVEKVDCPPSPLGAPYRYDGVSPGQPTGSGKISEENLVAAFDMESLQPDGRLRDFGPLANHGVLDRAAQSDRRTEGQFGMARRFQVVSDRVHLPENPSLDLDGPITIALWLRLDELGLHQHMVACDDKFALWITPQNRVRFSDSVGHGIDTADSIDSDRWFSLIAVFDGTMGTEITEDNLRLYVDGERAASTLINRSEDNPMKWMPGGLYPTDACYIGFESHQGMESHQTMPFVGAIDELAIYGRAFSDYEAQVHGTVK